MTNITVKGTCTGVTKKAVWVECQDGKKRSFAKSEIKTVSGKAVRGSTITLSVPQWVYDGAYIKGEQKEVRKVKSQTFNAPHTPAPANSIPAKMLDRLVLLCSPEKHGNDIEAMTAFGWLVSLKEEQYGTNI